MLLKTTTPICRECGRPVERLRATAEFCGPRCKGAFNNRRAARGAILYDLFMTMRFERPVAAALGVWRAMCRLSVEWREDDQSRQMRGPSWRAAGDVLADRPYLIVTHGPTLMNGRPR